MDIEIPQTKSGKLEARIAEIRQSGLTEYGEKRAIQLAIQNYETWASTSDYGRIPPRTLSGGRDDGLPPRHPGGQESASHRAMREDAFDPS